jgi:hypothetical protein
MPGDGACRLQLCAVASGAGDAGEPQAPARCSTLTYRLTRHGRLVAKIQLLVERAHFPPGPESAEGMLEAVGQDLLQALAARNAAPAGAQACSATNTGP